VIIPETTDATFYSQGALTLEGGLGVAKKISNNSDCNFGQNTGTITMGNIFTANTPVVITTDGVMTANNAIQTTTKDTGVLIIEGGVGIEKNVNIGGSLNTNGVILINNTTPSTNKDTGALVVQGGLGIEKDCHVGNELHCHGNRMVSEPQIEAEGGVKISTFGPPYFIIESDFNPPFSSGDFGEKGEFRWDSSYLYICIDYSNWHRIPHSGS
jgi:hypothetical protein